MPEKIQIVSITGNSATMARDTLFHVYPERVFSQIISTYTRSFDLSSDGKLFGDTNKFVIAPFSVPGPGQGHEIQMWLVSRVDHLYNNGKHDPFNGAEEQ